MNFQQKLQQGHEQGEIPIEKILHKYDWYTFPTYHYRSEQQKAPRLTSKNNSFISPDIDACKNKKRIWIECKLEEGANWTRTTNQLEHGIAVYLYENYLKVQEITGCPVWLFFLEYDQNSRTEKDFFECIRKNKPTPPIIDWPKNMLKGQLLSELPRRKNYNRQMQKDYFYFPQKSFLYFGVVQNDSLLPIAIPFFNFSTLDILEFLTTK